MKFKAGVVWGDMSVHALHGARVADLTHRRLFGKDATITSGRDGEHMDGSKHYDGDAFDLRTRHLDERQKALWARDLKANLGMAYDVVVEQTHIHVEFDPQ